MRIRASRTEDASKIARVHVDSWRETYQGIVSQSFLSSLSYREREKWWHQRLLRPEQERSIFVAENVDNEMVGFACGGPAREEKYPDYDGELYSIYILKKGQRQGVGKKLLQSVARDLLQKGYHSMLVWVIADNWPARRFYEAFHPQRVGCQRSEIGGAQLTEVCYGWPHLHAFFR